MIPLLLVRLQEERYAFYAQDVTEVLLCPKLRAFHAEISLVDGFFRLGADWVPVVSLASLLDQEPPPQEMYDALLLVKTAPRLAVRVSKVDGISTFAWDELNPLDSPLDGGPSAAARLEVDSEPVLLLVASDLLLEKERILIETASIRMAAREQRAEEQLKQLAEGVQ